MILKYKYHSDSGLLEAYRSYTLAQNNSLSDTIEITSTAQDAERYNYCLEFMCYNSKSIPKAQYISPILNYVDGCITFAIPNNLTEFRGHVDMQLTGYDPDDNSIVFKSISKNCKAFDVEGSLCVLEKDLNDTPNVFTEVLKQLEQLKEIHQDIIDEAMAKFSAQILDMVKKYKWRKVKFFDNGRLLEEQWVVEGAKLTPPSYTLPTYCVLVGGWYNPLTNSIWDLENDVVQQDTDLYLNYMTDDIAILNGMVASLGRHSSCHIYVPEFYEGYKVTSVFEDIQYVPYDTYIHMGNNMQNMDVLLTNKNIWGLYFPDNNSDIVSYDGSLYINDNGMLILAFAPKRREQGILFIKDNCIAINTFAINGSNVSAISMPKGMQYLLEQCIVNTNIEELTLPSSVISVANNAIYNNFNLKKVVLEGDCSATLSDDSFVNVDTKGIITRPKLCVLAQYYQNYKERNLAYEIEVMGQEFFDERYALKGV